MIELVFTISREVFRIEIRNKEIWYSDRRWNKMIRLIPADENFIKKIRMSRNKIPQKLISYFQLTEKEKKEYEEAETDKQLAEICIKDIRMKGGKLLKRN